MRPTEKRQFGRRESVVRATVVLPLRPPHACVVRNIGEGGALIDVMDHAHLPHNFRLIFEDENVGIPCRVIHTTGITYGVAFETPDGLTGASCRRAIQRAMAS